MPFEFGVCPLHDWPDQLHSVMPHKRHHGSLHSNPLCVVLLDISGVHQTGTHSYTNACVSAILRITVFIIFLLIRDSNDNCGPMQSQSCA